MGPKSGTNWSGLRSSFVSGKPWSGISFAYCFDSPIFFKKCLADLLSFRSLAQVKTSVDSFFYRKDKTNNRKQPNQKYAFLRPNMTFYMPVFFLKVFGHFSLTDFQNMSSEDMSSYLAITSSTVFFAAFISMFAPCSFLIDEN